MGDRFSLSPLFLSWKALFLRASAFCLVDATDQIPPFFVLRDHISLFFLCWLVDVSMSQAQYSCGFQGLGWTLSLDQHEGCELGISDYMPQEMWN